jgi:hypothetical protein
LGQDIGEGLEKPDPEGFDKSVTASKADKNSAKGDEQAGAKITEMIGQGLGGKRFFGGSTRIFWLGWNR